MIDLIIAFVGPHWIPLSLAVLAMIYRRRWRIADERMRLYMDVVIEQEAGSSDGRQRRPRAHGTART